MRCLHKVSEEEEEKEEEEEEGVVVSILWMYQIRNCSVVLD
jgi:hypothetical protein